jgi:hypothetical protein
MQLPELESFHACIHEAFRRRDFDDDISIPRERVPFNEEAVPLARVIVKKCREVRIDTPMLDKFITDPDGSKVNSQPGKPGRRTLGGIDSELDRIESDPRGGV